MYTSLTDALQYNSAGEHTWQLRQQLQQLKLVTVNLQPRMPQLQPHLQPQLQSPLLASRRVIRPRQYCTLVTNASHTSEAGATARRADTESQHCKLNCATRNSTHRTATHRNAKQRNAKQRNVTQRKATQSNTTQSNGTLSNAKQRNAL
jgi:hypothetical protein